MTDDALTSMKSYRSIPVVGPSGGETFGLLEDEARPAVTPSMAPAINALVAVAAVAAAGSVIGFDSLGCITDRNKPSYEGNFHIRNNQRGRYKSGKLRRAARKLQRRAKRKARK